MGRARRRARVRRGVAISTLSLAVAGGGVAAAFHLAADDAAEIDTYTSTLPAPDPRADPPTSTVTGLPVGPPNTVGTSLSPTATDPVGPGSPSTSVTTTAPATLETSTSLPTDPAAATTTAAPTLLDGPHTTPCGSVTFRFDTAVVVDSRTIAAGYRFFAQGEGTTEVEAKWFEGPGDECQVAAHLEDGALGVQFDRTGN
jgi:hypothetical protein